MSGWFLVVLFLSDPNAKIAIYPSEKECNKFLPIAIEEFKNNKDVKSIFCAPGELTKDEGNSKKEEWM